MPLAIAGFVEQGGNEAARIGAADIHHAGPERAKHGLAIIEQLLRRPIMGGFGHAVGFQNGRPKRLEPLGALGASPQLSEMACMLSPN
jgi:hypothetical protein